MIQSIHPIILLPMKRFYLSVCLSTMWLLSAMAHPISVNEARKIAADFLGCPLVETATPAMKKANGANKAYYLFDAPVKEGFVIVAGDTRMPQILGYSTDKDFDTDNMPPQLAGILDYYSAAYENVLATGTEVKVRKSARKEIIHTTAEWGQQTPYNILCPGKYTGCGATAMAILMKYHGYPEKGRGSHSYVNNGKTLKMDYDIDFGIADMPMRYDEGSYTTAQMTAVATLMYACGVALDMDYRTDGSYANMTSMPFLTKYFCYSNNLSVLEHRGMSDDEWFKALDDELDNVGPVLFRGASKEDQSGHIFLIDGRSADGYYHVNWGWNGNCNGYFLIDGLIPYSGEDYSYNHWMVINAFPRNDGEFIPLVVTNYNGGHGIDYNREEVVPDDEFYAYASRVSNRDNENHSGTLAVALTDAGGNIRSILKDGAFSLRPNYGYPTYTFAGCSVEVEVNSDDRLSLVFKDENDTDWHPVGNTWGASASIPVKGNDPQYAAVEWKVDSRVKIQSTDYQYLDKALMYSRYAFYPSYNSSSVTNITVKINGVIQSPSSWYYINPVTEDRYVIEITASPENSGIDEIFADSADGISIYNLTGICLGTVASAEEVHEFLQRLPKGTYIARSRTASMKICN